jgi:hypothetical protein
MSEPSLATLMGAGIVILALLPVGPYEAPVRPDLDYCKDFLRGAFNSFFEFLCSEATPNACETYFVAAAIERAVQSLQGI